MFDIESNRQFEKHLEEEIRKHIRTKGWQAAKILGQSVKADVVFRFQLK